MSLTTAFIKEYLQHAGIGFDEASPTLLLVYRTTAVADPETIRIGIETNELSEGNLYLLLRELYDETRAAEYASALRRLLAYIDTLDHVEAIDARQMQMAEGERYWVRIGLRLEEGFELPTLFDKITSAVTAAAVLDLPWEWTYGPCMEALRRMGVENPQLFPEGLHIGVRREEGNCDFYLAVDPDRPRSHVQLHLPFICSPEEAAQKPEQVRRMAGQVAELFRATPGIRLEALLTALLDQSFWKDHDPRDALSMKAELMFDEGFEIDDLFGLLPQIAAIRFACLSS